MALEVVVAVRPAFFLGMVAGIGIVMGLHLLPSTSLAQLAQKTKGKGKEEKEAKSEVMTKNIDVVFGIDLVEKLEFVPSTSVQVGNQSIVNYEIIPVKREITFKGRKPGKTSVILRNSLGDIKARFLVKVIANDQSKVVKEIREYLDGIEGLKVGIKGERVYVGGKIVVPGDIGLINTILKKYSDVLQLVELHPQSQRTVAQKMQNEIQKNGLPDVTVRVVNKLYWLEGIVRSPLERQRAEQIAIAYVPDRILTLAEREDSIQQARRPIIQNFIVINPKKRSQAPLPKQVKIITQFVELTKDYTRIFGFKWNPILGGTGGEIRFGKTENGGIVTRSSGTLSGVISNLFPKLNTAKSAGFARVIQSGILVVKDTVQGQIKKEAVDRFAIGNTEFLKADKAEAGFSLTVKPTILQEEQIELELGLDVSINIGDPPRTLANQVSTNLIVKSKESAVVGGVAINRSSTDFDKNPPAKDEAVENGNFLFSFIRSKGYETSKNQFVVFVTPEIIESASEETQEIKKKFRKRGR